MSERDRSALAEPPRVAGDWSNLAGQELRYRAVADMLITSNAAASVLDVGCGVGHLSAYLPRSRYRGIDCSADAIAHARAQYPAIDVAVEDVGTMRWPARTYTGIVFNESLYYLADPIGVLARSAEGLTADGVIVCSVYQKAGTWWRRSANQRCEARCRAWTGARGWPELAATSVTEGGATWHIWAVRP